MSYTNDPAVPAAPPTARLEVLLDAALELASEHDLDTVLERLLARMCDVSGATYAALGIYDADGSMTRFLHHGVDAGTAAAIGELPTGRGLLGHVIAADRPIRLPDLSKDPRSVGFPPHHPEMRSFLGVPIRSGSHRHGNLYLTDKRDADEFDDTDEQLVVALAAFAAAAIDNARIVDAERARADAMARVALAEQRSTRHRDMFERVISAQEGERARVARDLHDQIGQSLTSVLLALRLVEDTEPGSHEARARIEELRELITDTLDEVRQLAFDLRPTVLDDIGLVAALHRLADDQHARRGFPVRVTTTGIADDDRLRGEVETVIYRVVQEALTNIARHAGATTASVALTARADIVEVEVADDGRGFDAAAEANSLGLAGMAERAALVGGRVDIHSVPGTGTRVRLEVPRG